MKEEKGSKRKTLQGRARVKEEVGGIIKKQNTNKNKGRERRKGEEKM